MTIEQIIDKHISLEIESEIGWHGNVEKEMSVEKKSKYAEYNFWKPIASIVTDNDILAYENRIGYKLPASYIRFLKYKHFYALWLYECSFCPHPIHTWRDHLEKMIYDGWPTEYMIDKGRIPFAEYSDWGMFCFDTTTPCIDHDYPVVLWDHDGDFFDERYTNFEEMMIELDKKDDEMRNYKE